MRAPTRFTKHIDAAMPLPSGSRDTLRFFNKALRIAVALAAVLVGCSSDLPETSDGCYRRCEMRADEMRKDLYRLQFSDLPDQKDIERELREVSRIAYLRAGADDTYLSEDARRSWLREAEEMEAAQARVKAERKKREKKIEEEATTAQERLNKFLGECNYRCADAALDQLDQ